MDDKKKELVEEQQEQVSGGKDFAEWFDDIRYSANSPEELASLINSIDSDNQLTAHEKHSLKANISIKMKQLQD